MSNLPDAEKGPLPDPPRSSSSSSSSTSTRPYITSSKYAPNPVLIWRLRLFLYTFTSLLSLLTGALAASVVQYYNAHSPSLKPSWGSDIALIIIGLGTPFVLLGSFLLAPKVTKRGGVMASLVGQVRSELALLFGLVSIWISAALAMAADLRGYENCIWDGYYHYPEPTDFRHVCDLINYTVIFGYVTFGFVAIQWFVVTNIAVYILLYLDQDTLTEPANDLGGRAYRAALVSLSEAVPPDAEKGPGPMAGGRRRTKQPRSPKSSKSPRLPRIALGSPPPPPRRASSGSSDRGTVETEGNSIDIEREGEYYAPTQGGNVFGPTGGRQLA